MDNANVETVPSNGKTAKVIHNAYVYLKDRQLSEGKVGYECERRRGYKGRENHCRARIHVRDGLVVKEIGEHTHAKQKAAVRRHSKKNLHHCGGFQ